MLAWLKKEFAEIRSVLFTKTVAGALLGAVGYLSDPSVTSLLPAKWQWVSTAAKVLGGLLGAIGIRHAITKVGDAASSEATS